MRLEEVSMMTSGRIRRFWRRVHINMFGWAYPDYADPDKDTPERARSTALV